MRSRAVQVLYHLFAVARNTDQGVVGPVLTEYHMEEQHSDNLADSRLRQVAREGAEMLAADRDVGKAGSDPLLDSALDFVRAMSCARALEVLKSFRYPAQPIAQALAAGIRTMTDYFEGGRPDAWRVDEAPSHFIDALVPHIVGVEIEVLDYAGKWQVGQQRSQADRAGIVAALRRDERSTGQLLADQILASAVPR